MEITNIHKSLAEELLRCINEDGEKALITYGEMCSRANDIIDPRGSSGYIGNLSEICYDNDMPLISVMVVNANTYSPGGGFFRLYTQLTGKEVEDENSLFKEELKKVREYSNWDRLAELLNLDIEIKKSNPKKNSIPNKSTKTSYEEGKLRLKTHTERERNPKVVKDAKRLFLNENKRLYCELCGFDFEKVYGELGKHFIEGHHIKPISEMKDGDVTNVEDIKMLCSNCHRMVHRGIERGIDLDEIRNLINKM